MDDSDDENLWDFATRDVEPIERENRSDGAKPTSEIRAKKVRARQPGVKVMDEGLSVRSAPQNLKPNSGMDRRTEERLRKGQLPIEASLDLHGHNRDEARSALNSFILQAAHNGLRSLLVVTGKGSGPDGRRDPLHRGTGVLKQLVPEWLNDAPLNHHILKVFQARRKDGGEGALYVYLRRKR